MQLLSLALGRDQSLQISVPPGAATDWLLICLTLPATQRPSTRVPSASPPTEVEWDWRTLYKSSPEVRRTRILHWTYVSLARVPPKSAGFVCFGTIRPTCLLRQIGDFCAAVFRNSVNSLAISKSCSASSRLPPYSAEMDIRFYFLAAHSHLGTLCEALVTSSRMGAPGKDCEA